MQLLPEAPDAQKKFIRTEYSPTRSSDALAMRECLASSAEKADANFLGFFQIGEKICKK